MIKNFLRFAGIAAALAVASLTPSGPAAAAAIDPFSSFVGSPGGPGIDAAAVTPSDTVDLTTMSKMIVCGVAGNLNVITKAGTTLVIPCVAGVPIPIVVSRIKATSTTATGVVVITN